MEWIKVEDKLPGEETPVLVTDGENVWSAEYIYIGKNVYWYCHGFEGYDMEPSFNFPTHWVKLPIPPITVKVSH